jgi:dUTP pyrophosphatase
MPRRFEVLPGYAERGVTPPQRQTAGAAGYDIAAAEDVTVPPGGVAVVPTGLRVLLPPGEFLALYARSSLAVRRGLTLANGVGIIDADYAGNPTNGGAIHVALRNLGAATVAIARGERIAQAVFQPFALAEDDAPGGAGAGGFGSTGR